jgi:hypothetical protein
MRELLFNLPTPLLLLLIVGGSVVLTMAATYFVRMQLKEKEHAQNNEVAGFLLAAVGVVYGVLLAFMVLVVWQSFEEAQVTVEDEANVLVNIYRLGQELPEPFGGQVKAGAIEYAQRVINEEWDEMQFGRSSTAVDNALEQMWTIHRAVDAAKIQTTDHESQLFNSLNTLGNQRRIRLLDSRQDIPGLMWGLLISGGVITLAFTLFLRAPNATPHLLMAGLFAGLIAFVLLLIIELDNPFAGEVKLQPDAFRQALEIFLRLNQN